MITSKPDPSDFDLTGVEWQRSSHSGGSGNCVEVAAVDGYILTRDSKNPGQSPHVYTPPEVAAFFAGVKDGQFDHLVEAG